MCKQFRKIIFRVGRQYQNLGDALINKSAARYYSNFGDVTLMKEGLPSSYIEAIRDNLDSVSISEDSFFSHVVKIGVEHGFSNVYVAYPPGDVSRKGIKSALSTFRLILVAMFLKKLGVRFIRLGFSIGPFDKYNRLLQKVYGNLFDVYGLRDNGSINYAKNIGLENVKYFPDFSWLHDKLNPNLIQSNKISLSFRTSEYGSKHNMNVTESLAELIKNVKFNGERVYNYSCFYQVEFDRPAAEELNKFLNKSRGEVEFLDITNYRNFYNNNLAVISNRLHVLLYAMKHGCFPFALLKLNKNRKIVDAFKDYGYEKYIYYYEHLAETEIIQIVNKEEIFSDYIRVEKIQLENVREFNMRYWSHDAQSIG